MISWIMPDKGIAREIILGKNGKFTGRYKYYLFNGKTGKIIKNMPELKEFF